MRYSLQVNVKWKVLHAAAYRSFRLGRIPGSHFMIVLYHRLNTTHITNGRFRWQFSSVLQ
jgi:allophanate hydrolase subunit 1